MNSLFFNFIKRAFLVPAAFALVVIAVINTVVPKLVSASNVTPTISVAGVDISKYPLSEYDSFSKLEKGDYVATISSEEIGLNCAAVYNDLDQTEAVSLQKNSNEPWNDGCVAFEGKNLTTQFKYLHNAVAGTKITVDFYRNSTCFYTINKINYNAHKKDIKNYMAENTLVMAVPYVDFESSDDEQLYIVYTAELEGVE